MLSGVAESGLWVAGRGVGCTGATGEETWCVTAFLPDERDRNANTIRAMAKLISTRATVIAHLPRFLPFTVPESTIGTDKTSILSSLCRGAAPRAQMVVKAALRVL